MLTLPKLTEILFSNLRNSTWRLHDEGTQLEKTKNLAREILSADRGDRSIYESTETFKSKWLFFHEKLMPGRKTKVFRIYDKTSGDLRGVIRWSGYFRTYAFEPSARCHFSERDLLDVQEFIALLAEERRVEDQRMKLEQDKELK